jgi:hypothetical protein
VVHAKKEEGKEIKMRHDERKKVSLQTTSSDSLHCVNSSLNIFYSIWITLFVLEPLRVLDCIDGVLRKCQTTKATGRTASEALLLKFGCGSIRVDSK